VAAVFAAVALSGLTILSCAAQTAPTPPSKGQVIFSRSTGENGQTIQSGQPLPPPAIQTDAAPSVDDADRQAVTFTSFDLEVHLHPATQRIAVRARLTLRNDGKRPLARIPLQISSSLNWEEIRVVSPTGQSKDLAFQVSTLNSDADHTGQLHEAELPLSQTPQGPLAPGATLQLDVTYSGQIPASAQRLLAIGAPEDAALHSDWDQIGVPFTGLRGFGNVVWYPAASVPVLLGDGALLFDEMGAHKLRMAAARFRLRLVDEFPHGQAPTVAVLNGHSVPLTITESGSLDQSQEVDGVATASLDSMALGFEEPSLFVAIRTPHPGPELTAWTLPDDNVSVEYWTTAATAVTPFLQGWLGERPRSQLTLLDLPDPQDALFEIGALLAAPIREPSSKTQPSRLDDALLHALTRAWLTPPNSPDSSPQPLCAWLSEGVASFMNSLWVEKQQGRNAALRLLEADRGALALVEPTSPGESAGEPLAQATLPVYYRTKAAYVLWMLRDLAGDPALSAALRAYADSQPSQSKALDVPQVRQNGSGALAPAGYSSANSSATPTLSTSGATHRSFEKLLEEAGDHRDLGWFFADWVDADKGLPDLSISGVFPTTAASGNWLVAVDLANSGYAAAEIPLTVRSNSASGQTSVTRRVLVPARGKVTERILVQGKPTEVQANDGTVPETEASVHVMNLDEPASSSQIAPQ
jgi:hypothetical protein